MWLSSEKVEEIVTSAIEGREASWGNMLAAIEGLVMGQCYLRECRVDSEFIRYHATKSLMDGVVRHARAQVLGLG